VAEAPADTDYARKPWLELYTLGLPAHLDFAAKDGLTLFRAAVQKAPDQSAILYFDGALSYRDLDELSDALAVGLTERGFEPGDRLALYLQNMPAFPIAMLAAWKAGGIAVTINPMNRQRELTQIFADSRAKALVAIDQLNAEVVEHLPAGTVRPAIVITAAPRSFQTRNDPRIFGAMPDLAPGPDDLFAVCEAHRGKKPPARPAPKPNDVAVLVYSSGTTGVPKGAMITHGNLAYNGQSTPRQYPIAEGDRIFALAPFFHITGLITHVVQSWAVKGSLIMIYRFEPSVVLDSLLESKPAWMVGAITAYIALMNHRNCTREHFASFKAVVSGGAPIPASVVEEFERRIGHYVHSGYGLTETTAGVIAGPFGRRSPVDPTSGALSIGTPLPDHDAWVADENGQPLPVGEIGEVVIVGPAVSPGYWRKPEETSASMRTDGFRTGDVGFMDKDGWFYLVDRKKDMIVASGFKVWPREVEDVLYAHPAVREVAVVGVPDSYRGETVKAFVSMKAGASATPEELIAFCQPQMAAYKRPHKIEILEDLPKTVTGKILRRMLK
jgi:long-chain acyl-CoA synthetase